LDETVVGSDAGWGRMRVCRRWAIAESDGTAPGPEGATDDERNLVAETLNLFVEPNGDLGVHGGQLHFVLGAHV